MLDDEHDDYDDISGDLKDKVKLFALEYLIDMNGTQAAIRAGYAANSAHVTASRLLSNDKVQNFLTQEKKARSERLRIDADSVLNMYWAMATADYNEVSSVRRIACQLCHANDGTEKKVEPSYLINPDCKNCLGDGMPYVHIADTSKLSAVGKMIYQGAKQTKFGIEVVTADKMKALENVSRFLGMFKDTINHISDDGSMTPAPVTQDLTRYSDEELRQLIAIAERNQTN